MTFKRSVSHLALVTAIMAICSMPSLAANQEDRNCSTAREFIVTHQYLQDHQNFGMTAGEALKTAHQVAKGCSGAALRFTLVTDLLLKADLTPKDALPIGLNYALKSEMETHAFSQVFRFAFLDSGMDLDARSALALTRSLTTDFKGDIRLVREDFFLITDYCTTDTSIDLSRNDCGQLAARLVKQSSQTGGSVAATFVKLLAFLRDTRQGPQLATQAAIREAESLLRGGSAAAENYIAAYKYGLAKNGLALTAKDAMQFAREITLSQN